MSASSKIHLPQNGQTSCITLVGMLVKWITTPKAISKTCKGKDAACMQLATQIETLERRRVALENSANGCRDQIERWNHMGTNKPRSWTIRATVERALEFDKQARVALAMQKGLQKQQLMVENAQMNEDSVDLLHISRRIMAETGVGKYNIDDVVDAQELISEIGDDINEMTSLLGGTSEISDADVDEEPQRLMREDTNTHADVQPTEYAVRINETPDEIMKAIMDIVSVQMPILELPNAPTHTPNVLSEKSAVAVPFSSAPHVPRAFPSYHNTILAKPSSVQAKRPVHVPTNNNLTALF